VHPDQTENAAQHIPNAEVIRVQNGTHLCMWTDPTSPAIQERIATVLRNTDPPRHRSRAPPRTGPPGCRIQTGSSPRRSRTWTLVRP
jgi:hypothetical protein